MKCGSRGKEYEQDYVLSELFNHIEDYIITNDINEICLRISKIKNIDRESGHREVTFIANEIPIQEIHYTPPKLDAIPYHSNKFTMKERLKIMLKGKL